MLKNGTSRFKVNSEDEKISEIKRKSKSINKENIKKEKKILIMRQLIVLIIVIIITLIIIMKL